MGIAYALQEKTRADKIPSITPNHGNTASQDGRIFPYQFPVEITPYDETSIMVQYAQQQSGGSLEGKKIAVLYHGSAYGRETIGLYNTLSEMMGFTVQQIEVPHPGNEQTSIWMRVRQFNPDFVMLAKACHCHGVDTHSLQEMQDVFQAAFKSDRPTVIVVHEQRG